MLALFRHIFSILCLCLLVFGGQLSVCACNIEPCAPRHQVHSDCGHGGSADEKHDSQSSRSDCPCLDCHTCDHGLATVPVSIVSLGRAVVLPEPAEVIHTLLQVPFEISIPPKTV